MEQKQEKPEEKESGLEGRMKEREGKAINSKAISKQELLKSCHASLICDILS